MTLVARLFALVLGLATLVASPAASSAAPAASGAPASAPAATRSAVAHLEVIEVDAAGKETTSRLELAVVPDGAPSVVKTGTRDSHQEVSLAWRTPARSAAIVELSFEQVRGGGGRVAVVVQASAARDRRIPLAELARADGSRVRLAVTLK